MVKALYMMDEQLISDWTYLETENESPLPSACGNVAVHECFLQGKHSPQTNEDGIFVSPHFIAVVDGATAKSDFRIAGKTTGRLAMELVKDALGELPSEATVTEAVQAVTRRFHDFYLENGLLHTVEVIPARRLTACAVIYSQARQEVWQIGDCPCLIGDVYSVNGKAIDEIMASARAAFNEMALLGGESLDSIARNDPGRAFIMPFLERQACFQNNQEAPEPYAFAVFDGFPVPLGLVKNFPVSIGCEVVLASDGYPHLYPSLKESELHLRSVLTHDPHCMRVYKSTKGLVPGNRSFDDRAYIRFTVIK